jgi:glycosyltransferase involved in cell wall biosynthesis
MYLSYDLDMLSIHCREIIANLIKFGIRVDLCMPSSVVLSVKIPKECSVYRVGYAFKYSLVGTFIYQFTLSYKILSLLKKTGKPDLLYARQNFMGVMPVLLARFLKIPYFAEMNGISPKCSSVFLQPKAWGKVFLEKICLYLSDVIVTPSTPLKELLFNRYGIPLGKIHAIPNGFNEDIFSPELSSPVTRESVGFKKDDCLIGFIGSMGLWQGIEVLKDSIRNILHNGTIANARFVIVGDYAKIALYPPKTTKGNTKPHNEMTKFINEEKLHGKVFYHRFVQYEESAAYMNICDILVAPYTTDYRLHGGGAPMKLYSYLGCGKAVIISDLAEYTDSSMLKEHDAAFLVPPGDASALTKAIEKIASDSLLKTRLSENGRTFALQYRRWSHSCQSILEIHSPQTTWHREETPK